MLRKSSCICWFLTLFAVISFFSAGCSGSSSVVASSSKNHSDDRRRTTLNEYLLPAATGAIVYGNDTVSIDASNTSEGYFILQYNGAADKVKLQVTIPDGTVYTYTLTGDTDETFPLSGGNGNYHLDILENAYDDMYAIAFSQDISVSINDEFKPFLYPNQYVWFTPDSKAVKYAAKLSENSSNDLDYVEKVYYYVTETIKYDEKLAKTVESGYLPDIDSIMDSKKGICFDYASLMAAMLRSQGIPAKLVVGYSGDAYHAWLSVHLEEIGWVDNIIEFDGTGWSLMDPTLAAGNSSSSVKKYIGDGSNYIEKYSY